MLKQDQFSPVPVEEQVVVLKLLAAQQETGKVTVRIGHETEVAAGAVVLVLLGFWSTEKVLHNFDTTSTTIAAAPASCPTAWRHARHRGIVDLSHAHAPAHSHRWWRRAVFGWERADRW